MIDLFGENIIATEETKQMKMEQLLNSRGKKKSTFVQEMSS